MENNKIEIKIKRIISRLLDIGEAKITSKSTLRDLGADSIDQVEVVIELEKEFGIDFAANYPDELYSKTIDEISAIIETKLLKLH